MESTWQRVRAFSFRAHYNASTRTFSHTFPEHTYNVSPHRLLTPIRTPQTVVWGTCISNILIAGRDQNCKGPAATKASFDGECRDQRVGFVNSTTESHEGPLSHTSI